MLVKNDTPAGSDFFYNNFTVCIDAFLCNGKKIISILKRTRKH